jgi:uncharacterized membrane protein YgdD (TMEM256/DUF423 family)
MSRPYHGGRRALIAGALLMAAASAGAALGAHQLRSTLPAESYRIFLTAVLFQFVHALGLLCLGVLLAQRANRLLSIAADLLLAGVLLFSGSLYALLCGAPQSMGVLTPIGGLCLIVAWCVAAGAMLRARDTTPA